MSYTPKHAKPASAKNHTRSTHRGAPGTNGAAPGRHARHGGKAQRQATATEQARGSAA